MSELDKIVANGAFGRLWELLFDQKLVQYELKSVEVEIRTIEISSLLCGIHRGRLDNVMKDHISKLLPKKISKNIFKNFENFREIFSFFRFRKSENFQISIFSLSYRTFSDFFQFHIKNDIFEIWKMKIFPENFQNF